jgi:hypothetical protein
MRKLVFAGLMVLLAVALITCGGFNFSSQPDDDKVVEYTNVVYSADGRSLTLYLEGGVPVTNASRALTRDLALMGHDFFEVVFNHTEGSARASWEIGESAGIRNVYRTVAGIDYGSAGATMNTTTGNAVLFVGRKADKTLLAVGLLTHVNGASGTSVTTTTTSVTFSVTALEAGLRLPAAGTMDAAAGDTFLTSSDNTATNATAANTDLVTVTIGGAPFPAYRLPGSDTRAATYTLGPAANIAALLPGIRTLAANAAPAGTATIRIPRFPISGGGYVEPGVPHALNTTAVIADVAATDAALVNPIVFNITTGNQDGLCSLSFEVPVYALVRSTGVGGVPEHIEWFIRHGFGTHRFDLDSGLSYSGAVGSEISYGGSILLAVGDNVVLNYININIIGP